jgi:hypothetical protein
MWNQSEKSGLSSPIFISIGLALDTKGVIRQMLAFILYINTTPPRVGCGVDWKFLLVANSGDMGFLSSSGVQGLNNTSQTSIFLHFPCEDFRGSLTMTYRVFRNSAQFDIFKPFSREWSTLTLAIFSTLRLITAVRRA